MKRQDSLSSKMSRRRAKSVFVNDKYFTPYTQPKMLDAAQELLSSETDISEEAFLGAQAILLLNGVL